MAHKGGNHQANPSDPPLQIKRKPDSSCILWATVNIDDKQACNKQLLDRRQPLGHGVGVVYEGKHTSVLSLIGPEGHASGFGAATGAATRRLRTSNLASNSPSKK